MSGTGTKEVAKGALGGAVRGTLVGILSGVATWFTSAAVEQAWNLEDMATILSSQAVLWMAVGAIIGAKCTYDQQQEEGSTMRLTI